MDSPNNIHLVPLAGGLALASGFLFCAMASAQSQLPAPGRTIYKCQVNGVASYSDEPCIGAQRLEAIPTRGVDRMSGATRKGGDVANEIRSEQFAQALRPLTGMSAPQFATAARRQGLEPAARRECQQLESALLALEQVERRTPGASLESVQRDLFILRKRYKQLGC